MFHNIPEPIIQRMKYLEEIDFQDRQNGTPRPQRLRQIPPETGQFLALMASCAPTGQILEIGTSAGYSTLWLSLTNRRIITFEILKEKIRLAKETFEITGLQDTVELISGDARDFLGDYDPISFCFLDAEKEVYEDCYELIIPRMVEGGLLLADNAINLENVLRPFLDRALNDPRVDAMIVPVGKGILFCRKK